MKKILLIIFLCILIHLPQIGIAKACLDMCIDQFNYRMEYAERHWQAETEVMFEYYLFRPLIAEEAFARIDALYEARVSDAYYSFNSCSNNCGYGVNPY